MKNPFGDFRSISYRKRAIPLKGLVRARQEVLEHLVENYLHLVQEEAEDLVFWLTEGSGLIRAYEAALQGIQKLQYGQDDIEAFCAEAGSSKNIQYRLAGPSGIYISALINCCHDDHIVLRLRNNKRTFHFLGYRLPEGKTLILKGDVGEFIGASLAGGRLIVEGSCGNWCGTGMVTGEIQVAGNTLKNTGEWMRGGEIHVGGTIKGLRRASLGGKIYRRGKRLKCVFPTLPLAESARFVGNIDR